MNRIIPLAANSPLQKRSRKRKAPPPSKEAAAKPGGRRTTRRPAAVNLGVLDELIGYALRRAQVAVYQDFLRSVGDLEIRPVHFAALVLIGANPGISQIVVANALGLDRSAVVLLVDLLEGRQLAERRPSGTDRRAYSIVLTDVGRQLLARLKRLAAEHNRRVTTDLSEEERFRLLDYLRRIYRR